MAEPILTTLTGKLIASLATDAIKQAGRSVWKYYQSEDEITIPKRSTMFDISSFIDVQAQESLPKELADHLGPYLNSPECITVLEHIFAFKIGGRPVTSDGPLAKEVRIGCECHEIPAVDDHALVFNVLNAAIDLILEYSDVTCSETISESAIKSSSAIAMEVYLQSIDAQLAVLTDQAPMSAVQLLQLIERYGSALDATVGFIQPPNFDGAESVPIDDLYVIPALTTHNDAGVVTPLTIEELLDIPRVVVLGDPGGGKTTLSSKIANDLIRDRFGNASRGNQQILPIVIVLRDFGRFISDTPGSVADFIVHIFRTQYQLTVTTATIEWMLTTGRAYIVFDGLDELLETAHRKKIAQIVTGFASIYTNSKILVTSRRVGYTQAPLTGNLQVVHLGDFEEDQVSDYITKWFNLVTKLPQAERETLAAQLLQESGSVRDLRRNPLMLALICTIYRSESYIPRNRPDVYEKCSRMLFDRWDRHRGLLQSFEFEAHVEPALMHLAHSIYTSDSIGMGVTEARLIDFTTEYLSKWQYEDKVVARHAAETFVQFCRGRAWVFSDVGLTPGDEVLYHFTHRTFMEYFTACHLSRTVEGTQALCDLLLPHIKQSEWDVVAQLSIQLKTKSIQGGPDEAIRRLIRESKAESNLRRRASVLGFIKRCLTFLPISPPITRQVAAELVGGTLSILTANSQLTTDWQQDGDEQFISRLIDEMFLGLGQSAREIRELLVGSILEELRAALCASTGDMLKFATAASWRMLDKRFARFLDADSPLPDLPDAEKELEQVLYPIMRGKGREWRWPPVALLYRGKIEPHAFFDSLPLENMLDPINIGGTGAGYLSPLMYVPTIVLARCSTHPNIENMVPLMRLTADYVRSNAPLTAVVSQPDFAVKRVMIPHLNPDDNTMDANVSLTTSQLLDTLICLALAIDAMIVVMGENDEEVILPMLDYKWARDPVDSILRARLAGSHEWCKESFPDGVGRSILDGWINCRVNLWVTPVKEPKVRDTPDLLGHIAGGDAG